MARGKSRGREAKAGGKKGAREEVGLGSWRTPGSAESGALGDERAGPSEYAQKKGKPHGKK